MFSTIFARKNCCQDLKAFQKFKNATRISHSLVWLDKIFCDKICYIHVQIYWTKEILDRTQSQAAKLQWSFTTAL